jgi:hypothetical protein
MAFCLLSKDMKIKNYIKLLSVTLYRHKIWSHMS